MNHSDSMTVEQLLLTQDQTECMWYSTNVSVDSQTTPTNVTLEDVPDYQAVYVFAGGFLTGELLPAGTQYEPPILLSPSTAKLEGSDETVQLDLPVAAHGISPAVSTSTHPTKGITGAVWVDGRNVKLAGHAWDMRWVLPGEANSIFSASGEDSVVWSSFPAHRCHTMAPCFGSRPGSTGHRFLHHPLRTRILPSFNSHWT